MNNSVFKFPYNWARLHGIIGNIKHIPCIFKYAWQRITRGYADHDVWNFDTYLTSIITSGLRDLAEYGHTFALDFTPEEWKNWLKETADMLEEGADNDWWTDWNMPGEAYQKESERRELLFNEAFDRLKDHFGDLWD